MTYKNVKKYTLYYSKYCKNCNNVLKILGRSSLKNNIHFLSIDKRIVKNKSTYIVLDDGKEILLLSCYYKKGVMVLLFQ